MRVVPISETIKKIEKGVSLKHMGRLRFELRTNRLKAECSTAELATRRMGMPIRHLWRLSLNDPPA